jgi:hypothetical protein
MSHSCTGDATAHYLPKITHQCKVRLRLQAGCLTGIRLVSFHLAYSGRNPHMPTKEVTQREEALRGGGETEQERLSLAPRPHPPPPYRLLRTLTRKGFHLHVPLRLPGQCS